MTTKSLFRATLEEIPEETFAFVRKYTDILDRVHFLMQQKGMKQKDLAIALGKKESEVSKWLAGDHNFTLRTLVRIEKVLGGEILSMPNSILLQHKIPKTDQP